METSTVFMLSLVLVCAVLAQVLSAPRNIVEMRKEQDKPEVENQIFPGKKVGNIESLQFQGQDNHVKPLSDKEEEPEAHLDSDLKPLSAKDLEPEDHLDGVRMEQDGMLNKDFHKEIFLGEHEEIDDDSYDIAESKVKDIFNKVDTDSDGKMCAAELEGWIMDKTQEHFDEALEENDHIFKHMDPDGDGLVTWKEYYMHFLLAKGFPRDKASKHVVDYDEIELDYEVKESLIRYKFKWTDADIDPMDNKLSKKEFLAFRHPEQSEQALTKMVNTIMSSLDQDGDDMLTVEEFVTLPLGDMEDEEQDGMDKDWQEKRKQEFEKNIDADHDGKVTMLELLKYIDPRNPNQAKTDVQGMLETIDDNGDDCIAWDEILNHRDFFIQSKVVNVKRILHDEF